MELYLIRHARAAEPSARHSDDDGRPLVAEGETQARILTEALERLGVRFEVLCSSPKVRARQTAEALRPLAGDGVVVEAALAGGDVDATLTALRGYGRSPTTSMAAVGHEPHLSRFAALLLCGRSTCARAEFGTASVMALSGELRAGGMTLTALLPARAQRALLAKGDDAAPGGAQAGPRH